MVFPPHRGDQDVNHTLICPFSLSIHSPLIHRSHPSYSPSYIPRDVLPAVEQLVRHCEIVTSVGRSNVDGDDDPSVPLGEVLSSQSTSHPRSPSKSRLAEVLKAILAKEKKKKKKAEVSR